MSEAPAGPSRKPRDANHAFFVGLARAFGGAIIFSLPLLMTMEMWWLGFYADRMRLALFLFLAIPLLVGLSHYSGFEETFGWRDDLVDAFVAYAVAFVASAVILGLFGVIESGMSVREILGKVAVQAVPGSFGALLSASQFGAREEKDEEKERFTRYEGELFLMGVGAIFLGLNVAPTEEMVLIAHMISPWQATGLVVLSLLIMHAFVYALGFSGQVAAPPGTPRWSLLLRFTVPGYAIALLISLYVLWTFGRTDDLGSHSLVATTVVLGFPAAVGAAAARLVI